MSLHPTKLFGLLDCRQRWGFSKKGWIFFSASFCALFALLILSAQPFLSVSRPLGADILVVEGWISTASLRAAADLLRANDASRIFSTGGPIHGYLSSEFNTYAHFGYSRLIKLGVSENRMVKVPARITDRDRTYTAAQALRGWFLERGSLPHKIDVVTEGVHARRSRLLFQKAFGPGVRVGIISVPSEEYPAKRWWKYSAGVKDVISESAAYLYVRLFFWP